MENPAVKRPEMTLVGVSLRTTNAEEKGPNGRLPGFGKRTFKVKLRPRLMRIIPILSMLYIRIMKVMQQAHTPFLSGMKRRAMRFSQKKASSMRLYQRVSIWCLRLRKGQCMMSSFKLGSIYGSIFRSRRRKEPSLGILNCMTIGILILQTLRCRFTLQSNR